MIRPNYSVVTLSNGLRVVSKQTQSNVSYIGLAVNAGSRDESKDLEGLAHFLEHTLFKGTRKRRSWQISNRMESIGGDLNAYTSKEETLIYTCSPVGYEERSIELIADLIANSTFPTVEIDKEREVVIEEIYSYKDSPSDSVYDEFEELIYAGSSLAHNILGTPESVQSLRGENCREFLDRFYVPENMVLYCASTLSPVYIERYAQKYFGNLSHPYPTHNRILPPDRESFDLIRDKSNHQANVVKGTRLFGRDDSRRFALYLLNNYLGGASMNSCLNQALREKSGLVYTVESNVSLMSDIGLFTIYYGCDPDNLERCNRLISAELKKISESDISPGRLEKIKKQYCGQLIVSGDHFESRAMSMGKSLLYYDKIIDIAYTADRIMNVSGDEFNEVARMLHPSSLSSLTLL